jgi:hypothetical protein
LQRVLLFPQNKVHSQLMEVFAKNAIYLSVLKH